jgi:uncharacterized protein (TIGR02596 family)
MAVVAIIAVIGALLFGSYTASAQATAVTTSADMISDALSEARSDAMAQNMTVEVRFYQLPPQGGGSPVYCALQLHWLKPDGTIAPAAGPIVLPSWAVIDATTSHSPLIANGEVPKPDPSDWRLNGGTRVIHFLPDGSTDLNPATNWFLTVRAASKSDPANFPSDWASISVDATTGRPKIYRP